MTATEPSLSEYNFCKFRYRIFFHPRRINCTKNDAIHDKGIILA